MYKKCARQNAEEFDPHNRAHTQGTKFEIYDRKSGGGGGEGGRSQRIRDGNRIVTLALEEKAKSPNRLCWRIKNFSSFNLSASLINPTFNNNNNNIFKSIKAPTVVILNLAEVTIGRILTT